MNDKVIERLLELIRYKDAEIVELKAANKLTTYVTNRNLDSRPNVVTSYSQSGREL